MSRHALRPHPAREQILDVMGQHGAPTSSVQLSRITGATLGSTAYHVRALLAAEMAVGALNDITFNKASDLFGVEPLDNANTRAGAFLSMLNPRGLLSHAGRRVLKIAARRRSAATSSGRTGASSRTSSARPTRSTPRRRATHHAEVPGWSGRRPARGPAGGLPPADHQRVPAAVAYKQPNPSPEKLREIMKQVYDKYPLPRPKP